MKANRENAHLLKAGFVVAALIVSALGFHTAQQPGGNPDVRMMALGFAIYQLMAELVMLPLLMRSLARNHPYSPSDMLIPLAFHENGVLLGFVLTTISHDPSYLCYFGIPCLLLLIFTSTRFPNNH